MAFVPPDGFWTRVADCAAMGVCPACWFIKAGEDEAAELVIERYHCPTCRPPPVPPKPGPLDEDDRWDLC
jgi:hypothetical protein